MMQRRTALHAVRLAARSKNKFRPCSKAQTCVQGQLSLHRLLSSSQRRHESDKPFYITTPIFYVNAAPHVGHLYSMVLADIFKRWNQFLGRRALLCTGTDEHGMKVQQAATKAGSEAKPFCDKAAEVFKALAARANISNDFFIRTTDPDHKDAVQYAWTLLQERGYIYLSKHEGWYSVSDETYYPQSAVHLVIDPPTGRKMMASIETGKEVEWTSETNYRFRLSAMRDQLLEFYKNNPKFILPATRMKDVVRQVEAGLEDLSVSRPSSRLTWGIPVPTDDSQTIYVWLDALINYATKAGYPWAPGNENKGGWPADCHIIGKDIVRFHCIYWPAFLIALGLEPPKQVLTHAHWTLGREKMAKSTGNVVNPFFALDRFGVDVIRFYLAHEGRLASDSDYSNEFIVARYKKCLQSGLGGLASRIVRSKGWSVSRAVERAASKEAGFDDVDELTAAHTRVLRETPLYVTGKMRAFDLGGALSEVMNLIYKTHAYMQQQEPWTLIDSDDPKVRRRLDQTVFACAEALRLAGLLLQPIMPDKAAHLLDLLGVDEARRLHPYARPGADDSYGRPRVPVGEGHRGALFPPLAIER